MRPRACRGVAGFRVGVAVLSEHGDSGEEPAGWQVASERGGQVAAERRQNMAKIAISYVLTPAGQKADLMAGGTGKADRTIDVDATPELMAAANIARDGQASYNLHEPHGMTVCGRDFSAVLTPEQATSEVLAAEVRCSDRKHAEDLAFKAELADRDAWIAEHGSARLKKGSAAGMLDKMTGVYRSERIAVDLGAEWRSWNELKEAEESDRLNPREDELDALFEVRKRWPDESFDVVLRSVRIKAELFTVKLAPWRPALKMRLPWEREKWAVRLLDVEARREAERRTGR